MAASLRFSRRMLAVALVGYLSGCGYSQQEWDQKVRESEAMSAKIDSSERAREACAAELLAASKKLDDVESKLRERGVAIDTLGEDLAKHQLANEEYRLRDTQLEKSKKRLESLREALRPLTSQGLAVDVRDNRMLVRLPARLLFDVGQLQLRAAALPVLRQVAQALREHEPTSRRRFQVAAHTGAAPQRPGPYLDAWGVSAMRARSVLAFLTKPTDAQGGGLDPRRWSAAGYADSDPIASDETEVGRSENGRVELVVLPAAEEMLNLGAIARP